VRGGRPDRGSERKLWTSGGRPARNDRDARAREVELSEEEKQARALRAVRPRHDDPEIPEGVTARDLDKGARNELKTLSKENAEGVAQHLAMAARLIESDPELAHRHAISAARRAGRIGIVRETLAITAYATGDFALAIRELRTYRRISGSNEQLALMVDSERGVGRPDRALEVGRSVQRSELSAAAQVAVAIAMSGARLDLGQTEAALDELDIAQLNPDVAYSYSADLFSAYADVLEDLGRADEAESWRDRAARADAAFGEDDGDLVEVYEEDIVFDSVDDVLADAHPGATESPDASTEESGDEPVRPSES
jgi:tetratricopeptide (TPR) repeat protein